MSYVPTPLNIPTFILLRHRIRFDPTYHNSLKAHIRKNRSVFTRTCSQKEKAQQSDIKTDYRYISCIKPKYRQVNRDLAENRPWSLPPNIFNVLKKPYENRKGAGGAHWKKLILKNNHVVTPQQIVQQYDINKTRGHPLDSCNKHKGVFYSNARNRRPTSRMMVSDATCCWRDTNEPGPLDYCPDLRETKPVKWKSKPEKVQNPYKFIPHTTVPEKDTFLRIRDIFQPGPGRYTTFVKKACFMCGKKTAKPFITQEIEKEKRLKFRRLPYKKINGKKYCDIQYSHIPGHGFRHVFKMHESKNRNVFIPKEIKKKTQKDTKEYVRYADAGYIKMINMPTRENLLRKEPLPEMPVKIFYNCIAKRIKRKHLRSNKKIAFLSGQPRWKDAERPPIMTVSQLEEIKSRLPEERRLNDYPTMWQAPEEIKSKLQEIPVHMRPAYSLGLRKTHFKFQPIPDPKVLVLDEEVHPHHVGGKYVGEKFFFKPLNAEDFYKDEDDNLKSPKTSLTERLSNITDSR